MKYVVFQLLKVIDDMNGSIFVGNFHYWNSPFGFIEVIQYFFVDFFLNIL